MTCNNRLFVYDNSQYPSTDNNGTAYPSNYSSSEGTFILNGTAEISNFGGKVYTETEGATLRIGSKNGHKITIVEVTGKSPLGVKIFGSYQLSDAKEISGLFKYQVSSSGAWKNGTYKKDYVSKKGTSCYGFE